MYPDAASRAGYRAIVERSTVSYLFNGPGRSLDTLGGMVVFEVGSYLLTTVALLGGLLVVRRTRAEEESGHAELVLSLPVDRRAPLVAALALGAGATSAAGLAATLAMLLAGLPAAGSLGYGLGIVAAGWAFVGVAALLAQVCEHARTAAAALGALVAVSFALRGVADAGQAGPWLSWLSPLGWSQAVLPFGEDRLWTPLLGLGAGTLLAVVSCAVVGRRDLGAGLWRALPGRSRAAWWLRGPAGVAVRTHGGAVLAWSIVVGLLALVFGLVGREMSEAYGAMAPEVVGVDPVAEFVGLVATVLAVLAAAAGVQLVGLSSAEETSGRLGAVLAGPVGRVRWWAVQVTVALSGTAAVIAAGATGFAVGLDVVDAVDDVGSAARTVLMQGPAAAAVVGIAVLAACLSPRARRLGWVLVAYGLVVGVLADALDLPQLLVDASPFSHSPTSLAADGDVVPVVVLAAVGVLALAAGLRAFRRRDLV